MINEYYANIKGYERLYQISNYGTIKSVDKVVKNNNGYRTIKGKILKPQIDKKGYYRIGLTKDHKQKFYLVHRLVAETFIPNIYNEPIINHKNGNKLDNHISNLEWCTIQYNNQYGTCAKRRSKNNKISINQYDKSNNFIKKWESAIDIQNEIGINQGSVIACCRNKLKTAGGYVWKYAELNIKQTSRKRLTQRINELTDELNKEKEKNKLKQELLNDFKRSYIHKDKIKEKIKYYEELIKTNPKDEEILRHIIQALNEILEESEG